jgi:hypothetical protein
MSRPASFAKFLSQSSHEKPGWKLGSVVQFNTWNRTDSNITWKDALVLEIHEEPAEGSRTFWQDDPDPDPQCRGSGSGIQCFFDSLIKVQG